MYRIRIPIGIALLCFVGGVLYADHYVKNHYASSAVISLFILGALWEFFGLIERREYKPYKWYAMLATVCYLVIEIIGSPLAEYKGPVVIALLLGLFVRLFMNATEEKALEDCAVTALGLVYISFFMGFTIPVRNLGSNIEGVYYLLLVIISSKSMDIGGYLVGKQFGKHKICPSVSPKKSVEGTIGGLVLAVAVTFALCHYFPTLKNALSTWYHITIFAILMGSFSLFGDLCESIVKRRCDAKDSGNLLPEFGGVLDMVDSILFTMPIGYYFLALCLVQNS